jgi:hypothetical protein
MDTFGFSPDFVSTEKSLCIKDLKENIVFRPVPDFRGASAGSYEGDALPQSWQAGTGMYVWKCYFKPVCFNLAPLR